MGIFTSNTHSSISGVDYTELPALEGYDAVTGCAMAMLEVQQNDMALFNATIMEDFKEVATINEGYEVVNESAMDVLNKIKEIFIKLLQKIKGIFKTFLSKLVGTFGTNSGMYNKYKDQISSYKNWKGFTVKNFRNINGGGDGIEKIKTVGQWNINGGSYDVRAFKYINDTKFSRMYDMNLTVEPSEFEDTEEINSKIIEKRLPNLKEVNGDLKNMTEEYMNAVFEDPDTKDDWSVSDILRGCVGSILEKNAGGKFKTSVEEANKSLNDSINKIINELSKSSKEINDAVGKFNLDQSASFMGKKLGYDNKSTTGKMDKNTANIEKTKETKITKRNFSLLNNGIANLNKIAIQEQQVITSFTSARLTATKFLISQARRVWSSAAAYSSREHKNEGYEFYTAVGESAAYDFDSYMESIGE